MASTILPHHNPSSQAPDEREFPVLFTVEGSSRHEIILLTPTTPLSSLTSLIQTTLQSSPNAAEFLGKYRNKNVSETVREVSVKWALSSPSSSEGSGGRDGRVWVKETVVTEENVRAVLRMVEMGGGRDVLDVKVRVREEKKEGEEKK